MYTPKVIEHFRNPRNVGQIESADGLGIVESSESNDLFNIYIRIKDNKIIDVKFKTFGCAAAIASSSYLTDLAKGKTIEEALQINKTDVVQGLGGLPPGKTECSVFAVDAVKAAIKDFLQKADKKT